MQLGLRIAVLTAAVLFPTVAQSSDTLTCCQADDTECKSPEYSGKLVALIVGINEYAGRRTPANQLADLNNAVPDAKKLQGILNGPYVARCILNPDKKRFDAEFELFTSYLEKLNARAPEELLDSSAVFYFSGHGFRLDDVDRIILSGKFSSKQEAVSGSVQTFWINKKLAEFENIYKFVAFDACRNAPRLNWERRNFEDPERSVRGKRHFVFHSTNANDVASDGADGSTLGPLMSAVAHYFKSTGFSLERIHRLASVSPELTSIGQRATYISSAISQLPWSGRRPDRCVGNDDYVMKLLEACLEIHPSRDQKFLECLQTTTEACNNYVHFKKRYPFDLPAPCKPNELSELEQVFPELGKCEGIPSISVAMWINSLGPLSVNLAFQRDAIVIDAEMKRNTRINDQKKAVPLRDPKDPARPAFEFTSSGIQRQMDYIAMITAQRKLPKWPDAEVNLLRGLIFKEVPTDAGFLEPTSTSWLQPPVGPVDLYRLPNDQSGTTGLLQPSAPAVINCKTRPCTKDWILVQIPTGKGLVEGWMRADDIKSKAVVETVRLQFEEGELSASPLELEALRAMRSKLMSLKSPAMKIIIVAADEGIDEKTLADVRATRIRTIIREYFSAREDITTLVVVDGTVKGMASVELLTSQ